MKQILKLIVAALLFTGVFTGCKESYTTYAGAEYVMFHDTMQLSLVLEGDEYFDVPVSSTVSRDYDRTFGVEIIDKESNAIESKHYSLESHTITIKAGELATAVRVKGYYDNVSHLDSLGFKLKLVMPDNLNADFAEANNQISVVLYKSCTTQIENFTGWCLVSSMFIYQYMPEGVADYRRLVRTEKHPTLENTIIVRGMLQDGYDINVELDMESPYTPEVSVASGQIVGISDISFGFQYGDGKLRGQSSVANTSYFLPCTNQIALWTTITMQNFDGSTTDLPNSGYIGDFYNTLEWLSDEEAERLQLEEGL